MSWSGEIDGTNHLRTNSTTVTLGGGVIPMWGSGRQGST